MDLKEFGIVQRALLGIRLQLSIRTLSTVKARAGITELGGAYVAGVVEGGSASEAFGQGRRDSGHRRGEDQRQCNPFRADRTPPTNDKLNCR